ncbi:MAG: hypothetical protein CL897_00625 [Dehalococcoidia bacterium]|nr:hypothetical protein [Dehalococcoidia bacterium]
MVLGILRIRLRFVAHSRKEKRAFVKSVVERLRHRFNAAVTEASDLNSLDLATIAVACLASDAAHADSQLHRIAGTVEAWHLDVEVVDIDTELIRL